jgi:hypothetical protein
MLSFVELAPFTKAREAYGMGDDEFTELQGYLAAHPYTGDVIPSSGGCRKARWRSSAHGKRGGLRVIYFLRLARGQIVLVLLYGKNVRDNVKPGLLKKLREVFEHGENER